MNAPAQVDLPSRYRGVRGATEALTERLSAEDCTPQSMPDASPAKWHLAHTTWFFETFVLDGLEGYRPYHPEFRVLFNSYYNAVGEQYPRPERGLVTRPGLEEVRAYRRHVDGHLLECAEEDRLPAEAEAVVELGLHHEQQHQELILTDLKHLLSHNPLHPVYRPRQSVDAAARKPLSWLNHPEGTRWIGHDGDGFAFDNEGPRHRVFLDAFEIASRLVTNADYLAFMEDSGYTRPELWLSEGWTRLQEQGWNAPLYWEQVDGVWFQQTLSGFRPVEDEEPACHVSFFEADAFATWYGARLPTEFEWEVAAGETPIQGNFVDDAVLHPVPANALAERPAQLYGDVWEWTRSAYGPYPGYAPPDGALGEYNGKFMSSQMVLRGGSCATPRSHMRSTYRNFFYPDARWQFSGIRLARDTR